MPAKDDPKKEEKQDKVTEKPNTKPRYKVEETKLEVPEVKDLSSEKEKGKDTETSKEPEPIKEEKTPPKITSFSQLDSSPPSSEIEKEESDKPEEEISKTQKDTPENAVENETKDPLPDNGTENKKGEVSSDEIKEWLKEVRPEKEKAKEEKKGLNAKVIIFILVILAAIGALVGGIIYYRSSVSDKSTENETQDEEAAATSTPIPTPTPEPETEEVDLNDYSFNILNGSGTAGEAGRVNDLLEKSEFPKADTGNASSYDFTTTIVKVKEETPDAVYEKIKEALSETYIVEKSDEVLEESSSYDVVITVGARKES